jgi:hypothetical protein
MRMRAVAAFLVLTVTMTGCLSVKSYVDPVTQGQLRGPEATTCRDVLQRYPTTAVT